ncbi:hypothetical protein F0T03_00625 [Yersinia canariae]|uniref:Hemophore n=1 Tax=Yersinia canariae TaxID=2607663 RepID=A0A857EWJ4_9GAMM|nr:heme acquisition protein HasA [Yersinia canariae]QHB30859.1 hypothetical protein F0T03_00625 [Yersinia canariae]
MAIEINYQADIRHQTISSYTKQWATDFGDIATELSDSKFHLYSAGPNPPTVGVKYAIQSNSPQSKAAIVMESKGMHAAMVFEVNEIKKSTGTTLIEGKNENLQFGKYLIPIPDADLEDPQFHQLQLKQTQLKLSGINISDDIDTSIFEIVFAMLTDNINRNDIDLGVYNLLRGNIDPMMKTLEAQGIDVNTPLKDIVIARQFDVSSEMPVIDTVGVTEANEILLIA